MKFANAILDRAIFACAVLACIITAVMTVLITLEVILRSFFDMTMYFTDEYSGYMVLAIMALGVAYCREKNALLTVDFLIKRLSTNVRMAVEFVYGLAALAFCLMILYYITIFWFQTIERKLTAGTMMHTPLWIPQILLPIGFLLLCLVMIRKLFRPDRYDEADLAGDLTKE
jgi:TRAP-type C4-dicarboxylate transport system permease small subunit